MTAKKSRLRFRSKLAPGFAGMVVSQILLILSSVFIARAMAPTDFGVFSVWRGIVTVLAFLLTGRFELVLAFEADSESRKKWFISIIIIILCTSVLVGSLLLLVCLTGYYFGLSCLAKFPILMIVMCSRSRYSSIQRVIPEVMIFLVPAR